MNEDTMPSKRMVPEQEGTPLQKRTRAVIMRYFGLPSAGPYPGSAWQQLDPQYQRLADELIAATEAEIAALTEGRDRAMEGLRDIIIECDPADPEWANPAEGRRNCYDIARAALDAEAAAETEGT